MTDTIFDSGSPAKVSDILVEALPYIRKFAGMTIVIKYGGHAMVDKKLKHDFAKDITLLKFIGINPVVVHGGGPQINNVLKRMGIETKFIKGMRFTDEETMDVVEMVLGGKVNKSIVTLISGEGGKCVGLTGKDGGLILAEKMQIFQKSDENKPPEILDPGMVGRVVEIRPEIITTLSDKGFIPVIAPVGVGKNGETYNINADIVASEVASALGAGRLILMTDVDGVLDKNKNLISSIDSIKAKEMIDSEEIVGGMIPKIECALKAVESGVSKAQIINGTKSHAILLELFTNQGIGTEVFSCQN
ncbi:MAG: acetylglutamate kinase [Desulforegulaceae bacterium]|nr:acetylglutamate kinase [Desulforegulaceae bacterium]